MNEGAPSVHDEVFALLPDYAVGDLDDGELWRVAAHLDTCPICQRELSFLLETISLAAEVSRPSAGVRARVLGGPDPVRAVPPVGSGDRRRQSGARRLPLAPLALLAAALIIVAGFAVSRFVADDGATDRELVAQLLLDPGAAHAINDSELDVGAGGAMFTDPDSRVAYLVASGLPAPSAGQEYRIWLFMEDGARIAAGVVEVGPDGVGQAVVRAPEEFSAYWAVGVSLEPASGSDAPTSPLVVGGWLR